MSRVVSNLVNQNNLTPKMSIYKLNNYAEELDKDLKDSKAREHARNRFRNLGFSEEQVYALVPVQTSGKRVAGREPIKKTALYIMQNNLKAEEINEIAYDLAKTTTSEVAQSSRLVLLRKELRKLGADYHTMEATKIPDITYKSNKRQRELQELCEDEGFDCPDFFTLEKVQEQLQKCNTVSSPSMQNLTDIMIILCMRPADVENLRINHYKQSDDEWYNSKYSWYCTGYAKNKNEKSVPRPFLSMEKNTYLDPKINTGKISIKRKKW
nr:11968_t:CDS:1 [Entrophospora candida]